MQKDLWLLWGMFGAISMFSIIKMGLGAYTIARGGEH